MPRLRETESQRRAKRFNKHYRVGKSILNLQELQIASALGVSDSTLRKYKQNPDMIKIGKLVRLSNVFEWTDEQLLDILRGK